jgi:hypothetical protein
MAALPGDQKLMKKESGTFAGGYKPELDESPELEPTRSNFYQSQIGIPHWCVELGRIDIITEVSILSTYLFLPRKGHTWGYITMQELCLIPHTPLLIWLPSSRLIVSLCMVM